MKRDSRLSDVLHVLLHMGAHSGPVTSESLARAMGTNPVAVRRILAGLRERGYVASGKGHGGGWTIACDPASITIRDIYDAIGRPGLFAIGNRSDNPACLVEQAVNASLAGTLDAAEALILARLNDVTLDDLSREFRDRAGKLEEAHHAH